MHVTDSPFGKSPFRLLSKLRCFDITVQILLRMRAGKNQKRTLVALSFIICAILVTALAYLPMFPIPNMCIWIQALRGPVNECGAGTERVPLIQLRLRD